MPAAYDAPIGDVRHVGQTLAIELLVTVPCNACTAPFQTIISVPKEHRVGCVAGAWCVHTPSEANTGHYVVQC